MKQVTFELFRYQLLPITRHVQQDLFKKIRTVEDIEKNKNSFFNEIMKEFPKLRHRLFELNHKELFCTNDICCLKLGAHKTIERDNENFRKERIENWPNVTIIINNDPQKQLIAISRNSRAFSSCAVVADIVKHAFNSKLKSYQVKMHIEPLFDKKDFWKYVEKFENKLTSVRFELISPNMANISNTLTVNLKQLNKETNSHRTNVEVNSPDGTALEIEKDNEMVNGLVEYASKGGGDISIKVRGIRKRTHTSSAVKTVEVDEMTVDNLSYEQLVAFTDILNQ